VAPEAPPTVIVKPRRERVLVVLHSDGWVEVYARRNVDVRIVNRLHVTGGDAMTADILDALVECDLPKCYRWLYYPRRLRDVGQVRRITPEQKLVAVEDAGLVREVVRAWKETQ
jgi:hypothetical protein